jgi:hypothetical protein
MSDFDWRLRSFALIGVDENAAAEPDLQKVPLSVPLWHSRFFDDFPP